MRRRALVPLAAAALAIAVAGCASTGVTATRMNRSTAATFENLYRWKQKLEGESTRKRLDTRARCHRTAAVEAYEGAGSEWLCTVLFLIDGPGTQVSFNWQVTAKPDGCWNADGVPVQLGGQTIRTKDRRRVINPIYRVDGCFPAT